MMLVKDLLMVKGDTVWAVTPGLPLMACLKELADRDIGALLVLDGGDLVGIISERDVVRVLANSGDCVRDATVEEFMTRDVITVKPGASIAECMRLMTDHHIRHLPVVSERGLAGVVTIGDVVRGMIDGQESTITSLQNYIEGTGYGR